MMKNLSKLLSSRNLPFVDIYSSMLTDAGYSGYVNDVDGIHPTAAGEQFWAEQVEEFMFPL
jgi:lysophospholipase L1-like esterase